MTIDERYLGNKVAPGMENHPLDDFEHACLKFDTEYEKDKDINMEKFKGLILEMMENYEEDEMPAGGEYVPLEKQEEKEEDDTHVPTESRISKALSEKISKIVVSLVLLMLFLTPFFQLETYVDTYLHHQHALDMAITTYDRGFQEDQNRSWPAYQQAIETLIETTGYQSQYPLLYL